MSDLMPSEIREKVLMQHREIETMLAELETGVDLLQQGAEEAETVKRAAYALRGILELHMTFEETHLAPAVHEADGFGPERARHLHEEHRIQRGELDRLVEAILAAASPSEIQAGVERLGDMLRRDIQEEEENYLGEELLRDHIMPTDTFGG